MSGKYLRKRIPGKVPDPTMTHVDNPQVFKKGDILRDTYHWHLIVAIDDNLFNNPDIRFAHLVEIDGPFGVGPIYDLRENDAENLMMHHNTTQQFILNPDGSTAPLETKHITLDEARAILACAGAQGTCES